MKNFEFEGCIPQTSKFKDIKEGDIFLVLSADSNKEYFPFIKIYPKEGCNAISIVDGRAIAFMEDVEMIMVDVDIKTKIKYR